MDDSEITKHKRSANFTPNETILLMSLVSDLKHIVENKKTDGISMQEKNIAWKKITDPFNSSNPESRHRTTDSLKKCFENKKREVRKGKAEERKNILLTGGGPPKKTVKDPIDDLVLSIVDPLTVVGGTSYYGSDSFPLPNIDNNNEYAFELDIPQYKECREGNNLHETMQDENLDGNLSNINQESTCSNVSIPQSATEIMQNDTNSTKRTWKKSLDLLRPLASPLKRHRVVLGSQNAGCSSKGHKSVQINDKPVEKHNTDDNNSSRIICSEQNHNEKNPSRRRPAATVVRSLSSNQLSEKYNQLADKKIVIADYVLKKIKLEIENSTEEHQLKVQLLKMEIEIKKQNLQK